MGGSVRTVQVENKGIFQEKATQTEVQQAIWDRVHRKRFHLAEEAPICQGELREEFGYQSTTLAAAKVLKGTYQHGEEFDQETKELLEECTRMQDLVPNNSVKDYIRAEHWMKFWSRIKEDILSSESGLHFRHYTVGAALECIAHFHALKTTIALRRGNTYSRWS